MRKAPLGLGLISLGLWLLWFLIETMPTIYLGTPNISEEMFTLLTHALFVFASLALIVLGVGGREE